MFTKSAAFYDVIYSFKDYTAEANTLRSVIQAHQQSTGNTLLDVACGTGIHLQHLQADYRCTGLDLDANMLKLARERCPDIEFHEGNMQNFQLNQQFDVVTCLFSSIGYVQSLAALNEALNTFAQHSLAGGLVIVEPWFTPETFRERHIGMLCAEGDALRISRLNTVRVENGVSHLDFHYLVGTPDKIDYFTEHHALGLFTDAEYRAAFTQAGLTLIETDADLMGRGIYVGRKENHPTP
jgi:SAM-dependent methyltransferase